MFIGGEYSAIWYYRNGGFYRHLNNLITKALFSAVLHYYYGVTLLRSHVVETCGKRHGRPLFVFVDFEVVKVLSLSISKTLIIVSYVRL